MLPTTIEWVAKAEGDFDVVMLLIRSRKPSRYDSICFHCQQCVEKYLKACLTESSRRFPKTHDLMTLVDLAAPIQPAWRVLRTDLDNMSGFAVVAPLSGNARNPGGHSTRST
jgi:HEPN domain-containing protein